LETTAGNKNTVGLGRLILRLVDEETALPDSILFRVDVELTKSNDRIQLERIIKGRLQEAVAKTANPQRSDEGVLRAVVR